MSIRAKVICDSISDNGVRLTTVEATFPRLIHAQINTHRSFSRGSSSNRAVTVASSIEQVLNDPVVPVYWGKKQKGMVAHEEVDEETRNKALVIWLKARDDAVESARELDQLGVHKQITNRILEPWRWSTVVITATDWDNFFNLRVHQDSQPETQHTARAIYEVIQDSKPKYVPLGRYHTPYILEEEYEVLNADERKKVSVARCARASYESAGKVKGYEADFDLYDRLANARPIHIAPFENVATPAQWNDQVKGNFRGWHQLRHEIEATL